MVMMMMMMMIIIIIIIIIVISQSENWIYIIQQGPFLLLDLLLNAGGRVEICGILKASILNFLVLRKHGIFSFSNIGSLDCIDNLLDVW